MVRGLQCHARVEIDREVRVAECPKLMALGLDLLTDDALLRFVDAAEVEPDILRMDETIIMAVQEGMARDSILHQRKIMIRTAIIGGFVEVRVQAGLRCEDTTRGETEEGQTAVRDDVVRLSLHHHRPAGVVLHRLFPAIVPDVVSPDRDRDPEQDRDLELHQLFDGIVVVVILAHAARWTSIATDLVLGVMGLQARGVVDGNEVKNAVASGSEEEIRNKNETDCGRPIEKETSIEVAETETERRLEIGTKIEVDNRTSIATSRVVGLGVGVGVAVAAEAVIQAQARDVEARAEVETQPKTETKGS